LSLKDLPADGCHCPHRTSAKEVAGLPGVVDRDLRELDNWERGNIVTTERLFTLSFHHGLQSLLHGSLEPLLLEPFVHMKDKLVHQLCVWYSHVPRHP
jgi:hypothetical protein